MSDLINRVKACRLELKNIGAKNDSDKIGFIDKFRNEYTTDQINDLWEGVIESKKFTQQLESFVTYKKLK